jgi:hypothetical protein
MLHSIDITLTLPDDDGIDDYMTNRNNNDLLFTLLQFQFALVILLLQLSWCIIKGTIALLWVIIKLIAGRKY